MNAQQREQTLQRFAVCLEDEGVSFEHCALSQQPFLQLAIGRLWLKDQKNDRCYFDLELSGDSRRHALEYACDLNPMTIFNDVVRRVEQDQFLHPWQ